MSHGVVVGRARRARGARIALRGARDVSLDRSQSLPARDDGACARARQSRRTNRAAATGDRSRSRRRRRTSTAHRRGRCARSALVDLRASDRAGRSGPTTGARMGARAPLGARRGSRAGGPSGLACLARTTLVGVGGDALASLRAGASILLSVGHDSRTLRLGSGSGRDDRGDVDIGNQPCRAASRSRRRAPRALARARRHRPGWGGDLAGSHRRRVEQRRGFVVDHRRPRVASTRGGKGAAGFGRRSVVDGLRPVLDL